MAPPRRWSLSSPKSSAARAPGKGRAASVPGTSKQPPPPAPPKNRAQEPSRPALVTDRAGLDAILKRNKRDLLALLEKQELSLSMLLASQHSDFATILHADGNDRKLHIAMAGHKRELQALLQGFGKRTEEALEKNHQILVTALDGRTEFDSAVATHLADVTKALEEHQRGTDEMIRRNAERAIFAIDMHEQELAEAARRDRAMGNGRRWSSWLVHVAGRVMGENDPRELERREGAS